MDEKNIIEVEEEQYTIDKHYHLMDTQKSTEIIQKAMDLAREEIPKGAVATYIPELGKADPHQLVSVSTR